MNSTEGYKTWQEEKIKLKQKRIGLISNDLKFDESKRAEVSENLQIKLGKTKEEINMILNSLF
jgi:hypothetical protein